MGAVVDVDGVTVLSEYGFRWKGLICDGKVLFRM